MGFAKLDSKLPKSSLWGEPYYVRIVFVTFLAEKDSRGFVSGARSGMIRTCNVLPEEFDEAVRRLEAPDPDSRTPDYEGRRIKRVDGGWMVLNHQLYRDFSYSGSSEATRKRDYRERRNKDLRASNGTETGHVPKQPGHSVSASASDQDPDQSKKKDPSKQLPTWVISFDEYQKQALAGAKAAVGDPKWVAQRQEYFRRLDIEKSVKKAYTDFWGTKAGWARKKKQCRKKGGEYSEIDWKATYRNALDMRSNKVWLDDDDNSRRPGRKEL